MGRHHDEPSDETPELDGETDPSTRTLAPTSMIELGETDDVNRSPENEKNVTFYFYSIDTKALPKIQVCDHKKMKPI